MTCRPLSIVLALTSPLLVGAPTLLGGCVGVELLEDDDEEGDDEDDDQGGEGEGDGDDCGSFDEGGDGLCLLECADDSDCQPEHFCSDLFLDATGERYCLPDATCGNGVVEVAEACDGDDVPWSCEDLGLAGGTVECLEDCTIDVSDCSGCGDGVVGPTEECDGNQIEDCEDFGAGTGGVRCDPDTCTLDFSECVQQVCGDGIISGFEICDGANVGGQSCESFGFSDGTLLCESFFCDFLDTSGCFDTCGDGIIGPTEGCEDDVSSLPSCEVFGLAGGDVVSCDLCQLDTSACTVPVCGNDIAEGGFVEQCDGADLRGEDCVTVGFADGTLACTPQCALDVAGCFDICGDEDVTGFESCDGVDLLGFDCASLGFADGVLACDGVTCERDTTGCFDVCGDFQKGPTEQCDDGDNDATDGCDACVVTACLAPALIVEGDTTGTTVGGDEFLLSNSCSFGVSVPSDVYALSVPGAGSLTVTLSSLTFQSVGVRTACADAASEIRCDFSGSNVSAVFDDADDVFVTVMAGFEGEQGPYTLTVDFAEAICGDATIVLPEVCEPDALGGETCESLGFASGTLLCDPTCLALDTSGCVPAVCGNDAREGFEVCDGADLGVTNAGTATECVDLGYDSGTLACLGSCAFDVSQCIGTPCAHDVCEAGAALDSAVCNNGCAGQVCAVDDFCCDVDFGAWDGTCVDEAIDLCGVDCA
jgi:hypothetical protein